MISSKLFDPNDYKDIRYASMKRYFESWWNILQLEDVHFTYSSLNRAWEYAQVVTSIPEWNNKIVLDLGASASLFEVFVARMLGSDVTTIDNDPERIRQQLRLHFATRVNVRVVQADIQKPFDDTYLSGSGISDGEYDIVTSFSVIEHLTDLRSLVSEMKRVCKKGGYIGITTDFAPDIPDVKKSGTTFNKQQMLNLIEMFNLPIVGESDYENVDVTKPENLAVDGIYTFASLVMQNI